MPQFRCLTCKAHFYSAAGASNLIDDRCPDCGHPLETLDQPAEVVDFRAALRRREQTAERIGHLIARREVHRAQARVDAEGWDDDGGVIFDQAAALPRPRASS